MSDKRLVLTIARGYGSGGRTMAKRLSEELGLPMYDKEILRMASDESGINEELFGRIDEKVKKIFLATSGKYKGKPLSPSHSGFTSDDNLFELQAEVIRRIAETENCIFVGRCADYILKDKTYVTRIYMYASEEDCLHRLKQTMADPDEVLIERMHSIDRQRAGYYKYYTGHEWDDAKNYDLCLNTGKMSYSHLVNVVRAYLDNKTAVL